MHALRHTFASLLRGNGADVTEVRHLLGRVSASTSRCLDANATHLRQAVAPPIRASAP